MGVHNVPRHMNLALHNIYTIKLLSFVGWGGRGGGGEGAISVSMFALLV